MGYSDAYPGGYGAGGDLITNAFIETDPDTWYDITDLLISGNITRGRQHQLDRYQAGVCTLALDNDERTFDPNYPDSPLDGHILPMKRVKVTGSWDGVTYPLFLGYADRWVQNREGPHRGTTTLEATDGFKVLERATLGSSVWAQELAVDGPVAWWRFDDAIDAAAVVDSAGGRVASLTGSPEIGVDGLVARDASAAFDMPTDADGAYSPFTASPIVAALPLTVAVIVRTTDTTGNALLRLVDASGGNPVAELSTSGTNAFFTARNSAGSTATTVGGDTVTDGNPHLLVGVWDGSTNVTLYVDGAVDGTPTTRTGTISPVTAVTIGGGMPGPLGIIVGTEATVDEVMVFNTAVSAGRIAAWAEARSAPWGGDLSGERVERVLDTVGWPAADRDIDTGQATLQSGDLDGMSALEHLQKVAETEPGNLYITADGRVRFEDRNSGVNQPAAYAFSDAAGTDLPITFSNPELSDDQIRNDVTVSRLDGAAQTARDATSIAAYQTSSYTLDGLYNDDDDHSRYLADFILNAYKDPVERVSQMSVNPYRDPDNLWPAVLGLELTDRVTLEETPQWVGDPVTRTLIVEGVTHTFGPKHWDASFNLSENAAATATYWQLGVAGFSELGDTTRLYF